RTVKLFVFSFRCSQPLAATISTQRSLELYTGFYTTYNSKPTFFTLHQRPRPQTQTTSRTSNPTLQSLQNRVSSEALDYSTSLEDKKGKPGEFAPMQSHALASCRNAP
ncbi:MAG: hypothetical protein ACK41V_16785, partial [Acidovorax sp.]|uniref:hypothetical protein n=1 Tax=Acidovorax sp. TaxID=1872122 RepID=UPI0039189D36